MIYFGSLSFRTSINKSWPMSIVELAGKSGLLFNCHVLGNRVIGSTPLLRNHSLVEFYPKDQDAPVIPLSSWGNTAKRFQKSKTTI